MTTSATTVSVSFGIETNNAEAGPSTLPIDIQPFPPMQIITEAEVGRAPFESVHSNVSIVTSHPNGGTVTALPQEHKQVFENLDITTGYFDSKLIINDDQKYIYTQSNVAPILPKITEKISINISGGPLGTVQTLPQRWKATEVNIISHGQAPALDFLGTGGQVTYTFANHENQVGGVGAGGDEAFITAGTHSWTAPAGVTSVSVVAIGGGGGGGAAYWSGGGGGGGGLGWKNNISVTPGSSYTVVVGDGGTSQNAGSGGAGGESYFINNTTVSGSGGGGGIGTSGTSNQNYAGGAAGGYVGDGGGNGGVGGTSSGDTAGAGGGAGGYSGNGGRGSGSAGSYENGSGGGGAGGSGGGNNGANGAAPSGGGVGIFGEGTSGSSSSAGGSGGTSGSVNATSGGSSNTGGTYGGGGGGQSNDSRNTPGCQGKNGVVRILWGSSRSFPSTNTGDTPTAGTSTTQITDPQPVFSYSSFPSNLGIERILTNKSITTSATTAVIPSNLPTNQLENISFNTIQPQNSTISYPNGGVAIQTHGTTRTPIINNMNNLSVTTNPLGFLDNMPTTVPTINTTLKSNPSFPKSINVSKDVTFGAPSYCNSVSQTILIANEEPLGFFTEDGFSFFAELTDQNDPRLTTGTSSGGDAGGEGGEGGGSGSGPVQTWN